MSKDRDRIVYRRGGEWVNKRNDAGKASSTHPTQSEAIEAAKEMLRNQGGGELSVKGLDGKIRSKDTISHGKDPCPPIDRER